MKRFEISSDTRFLLQIFEEATPGETVTYERLSKAIGRDVRQHAKSSLYSAVRMSLNEGRVFESEPNVGYRLLTAQEIVKTSAAKGLSHVSRTVKRTARKVACADYEKLDREQKIAHNTQLSMLGAVQQMTKPTAMKRIEAVVRKNENELSIGDTLKLMTE